MTTEALTHFIIHYIASRRQPKLDAFEKEAAKRLAQGEDAGAIAQERQELEVKYQPRNWLTDAARRAGQISLVTHAAKFTHGDSKSSSIYRETLGDEGYLSTAVLANVAVDAVGNAAALDVAKLLQTEVGGDSLLACLKRGDRSPLMGFAENDAQLALWMEGFSQALTPVQPASHKLAKQIYFPVDGGYHLLSPLFATSLAQAMHEKMVAARFGEQAKAAREARRAGKWHAQPDVRYPNVAEMHFGGTKPQNISALNSSRGGRVWLLPSQPPKWTMLDKAPQNLTSLFALRGDFNRAATDTVSRMVSLLKEKTDNNNRHIRNARAGYVDELIDLLFLHAATYQQEAWQGWTLNSPDLPLHQQLWLDPWRSKTDETFRSEREKGDWQRSVADDFARWLNYRLNKARLDVGIAERREWQTQRLFSQRMREMEAIVQEALK
ncbi:type I-F CRISPR-associated protein Csy1 [Klebsiella oxytoca]|uniref:type I-F CRISPR-associated protein Csy1 n=1 Tax=Klebsiella oxytoca TaxID=571 RepID=UPI000F5026A5|nr:type I-F CRISPR-associated protein Csy1 [Klebsiella oxytoca]AYZ54755.1 type I-F CRISPR-associated protein Csy1 [Klebsiella oxytoca]EIX9051398.1 type I-F CRISPR-associated protein Csy1 [Klebsiella oxytoca]EJV1068994.1 type I-F CRISPR-associated protein Csy1 [Klebsiella oxytoca]EKW3299655.1 type I-F CRISPR-associated protein Csy1 [Klebsiella oxytoca]HBM2877861.1 type I-F CRISPR-associated protein Csy1 [Klebsiella oxytoca]